jgi:ATP-dependent 26S proteasome regulatory subunit
MEQSCIPIRPVIDACHGSKGTSINKYKIMKTKITNYIRAGYPGLYLVSAEEQRVEAELKAIAKEVSFNLFVWSATTGMLDLDKGTARDVLDPMEMLNSITDLPEKSMVILRDFHLFLGQEANPLLVRKFKDVLLEAKTANKTLIVLGCRINLPPELDREMAVVEFALPDKTQLDLVLNGIMESAGITEIPQVDREKILDAATGLTTMESENAFALSVVEHGNILAETIAREKAQTIKKNGLLEIVETTESLDSIGGLDCLKTWLTKRKSGFGKKALEYGLPTPKGLMIMGIAGTGKSLTAKATAKVFGIPLLKLDAGRIFGGLVGQSEGNLRSVIQTAEAIAPCCLWVDELEKGFSGSKSSGASDGGTSSRVLGSFLSWMQEKKAPVFVVATANDVTQLPPELLRKGRWDELFFVDLPSEKERACIWEIQIRKHGRNPADFDLVQLARMTQGLTGSEIECAFVESLYQAFDEGKEPTDLTIATVLNDLVPLSKLMSEQIAGIRNWAKGRARMASTQQLPEQQRKLAV